MAWDWTTFAMPVIVAVIPVIIAGVKKIVPPSWSWVYPLLATGLGAVLETVNAYATGAAASPGKGAALGLVAVGVREIIDQLKKLGTSK